MGRPPCSAEGSVTGGPGEGSSARSLAVTAAADRGLSHSRIALPVPLCYTPHRRTRIDHRGQPLTQPKPTITGTTHELPFGSLSPRDFERLCLWLVEREGRTHASYLLPWPNPSLCESFVLINTHCPEVSGV